MDMTTQANTLEDALDEQLAVQAKGGDSDALALLIQRYIPLVRLRAKTYCKGVLDEDDLFQEGMIALLKAIRNYRSDVPGSFKTFAFVCVNNKLISAVTAHMREKNTPMRGYLSLSEPETATDSFLLVSPQENGPEQVLIRNEEAYALNRKIENLLSLFERQVLCLYLSSYSYDEMSRQLGSSTKAVDNALQRVRRKLRNAFSKNG